MDGEALGVMQRAVGCVLVSHDAQTTHRTVDDDNCFTVARKPDPVRLCGVQTPQVVFIRKYISLPFSLHTCFRVAYFRTALCLIGPSGRDSVQRAAV